MSSYQKIEIVLIEIESELRRNDLWEQVAPEPEALASEIPFCFDTMEFHQWLQWIFLPRMRALLEARGPLPTKSEIHPIAEYRFSELGIDAPDLLEQIARIDRLITDA